MSADRPRSRQEFTARARVGERSYAARTGRSKKEAEQGAAEQRLARALGRTRRPGRHRRPPQCLSCPRSRPSAPGSTRWVARSNDRRGRGQPPPRRPSAPAGRGRLRGAAGRGPVWSRPSAAASTCGCRWTTARDALVAHLGMSGQLLVQPAGAPDETHLHVRIRFAATVARTTDGAAGNCGSSTSAPSAACNSTRWCDTDQGDRVPSVVAHIARDPFDPHYDLDAVIGRGPAAATARSSGCCWTRRWCPASATSTPTRRSGGPASTATGWRRRFARCSCGSCSPRSGRSWPRRCGPAAPRSMPCTST